MIIEFFGLSKTGKTSSIKRLKKQNYNVIAIEDISHFKKLFFFLMYFLKYPSKTFNLFHTLNSNHITKEFSFKISLRVLLMRNSYLAATLAKFERIKNKNSLVFTDEFLLQSLFMILQKKSNEKEIKKVLNLFSFSKYLFIFERAKSKRYKKYNQPFLKEKNPTHFPGGWIDISYARKWMENMEHNYTIIKRLLLKRYKEDKNIFPDINKNTLKKYILTTKPL